MTRALAAAFLLAVGACSKEEPPVPSAAPAPAARPERLANGEPSAVTVKHVLVAFAGAERSEATRTKAEAEKLAYDILAKAKAGADFDALMKQSDDRGGGTYAMSNTGVAPAPGEMSRGDMVRAFGDVGFRLEVGEVGFAFHDEARSPFGFHVIKRVK